MNIPYYKLNIDVNVAIKSDFVLDFGVEKDWIWPFFENDIDSIFNPDWLKYMKDKGLNVHEGTIFYKTPNLDPKHHIHIDSIPTHPWKLCYYGINWLMDLKHLSPKFSRTIMQGDINDDSEMVWYHQSEYPIRKLTIKHDKHDRTVNYFTGDYKSISHRVSLGKDVYMVKTSIPHSVETRTSHRLAISLRNVFNDNHNILWDDIVEKMKPWII